MRVVGVSAVAIAMLVGALGALLAGAISNSRHTAASDEIAVTPSVTGIRSGSTFSYLVQRDGAVALVDAGSDPNATAIVAALRARGLAPEVVSAVLLTHGHIDTWAGAARFTNAVVYLSEGDFNLIVGGRLARAPVEQLKSRFSHRPPAPQNTRLCLAGEVLKFGPLTFQVIATPGHTKGTLMFRHDAVLFTGDGLWVDGGELALAPWYVSDSRSGATRSLSRLAGLPFSIIADASGGVAQNGSERLQRWLALRGGDSPARTAKSAVLAQ